MSSNQGQPFLLRPEALETFMYLHRAALRNTTQETIWEQRSWDIFLSIRQHCKVQYGYSGVADVQCHSDQIDDSTCVVQNDDVQPSYWIAETLKYLLLIFTPQGAFSGASQAQESHRDLDLLVGRERREGLMGKWVLNTEGHFLKVRPDMMDVVHSF